MDSKYSIRATTLDDLNGIVDVVLVAMPHDPQWDYRFLHKHEFPEDHYKYTRLLFEQFISPANDDWYVMLAESSTFDTSGPGKIVAFAVWDVSYVNQAKKGPGYEKQNPMTVVAQAGGAKRRDVIAKRQAAFRTSGNDAKKRLIDDIYSVNQLHLQILGVNPDHWRQKIGTQLVRWGLDTAAKESIPLTLFAGSAGMPLYLSLGFKHLGRSIVQVQGEEEAITAEALVYEPPK